MVEHVIRLILLLFTQYLATLQQKMFCLIIGTIMGNTQVIHQLTYYLARLLRIMDKGSPMLYILAIELIAKNTATYPVSALEDDVLDVVLSEGIGS